jgi:uncharacterized protein DUF6458
MTSATSLILIAVGAVLAFAVSFQVAGINIQTIGAILIIVGAIGLAISLATLAGYAPWGANRTATPLTTAPPTAAPATPAPPANV